MIATLALPLLLQLSSGTAPAKRVVLAMGECFEPLTRAAAALTGELEQAEPGSVLSAEDATRLSRRESPPSVAVLKKKLEAATDLAFRTRFREAEKQSLEILNGVQQLPPGPERIRLAIQVFELRGFLATPLRRPALLTESLRRILLVDPQHKLDDYMFPPPIVDRFDGMKRGKELGPSKTLRVASTSGREVEIFIDGASKGKTPATFEVVASDYIVEARHKSQLSLPRAVSVADDTTISFHLPFESSLTAGATPCAKTTALSAADVGGAAADLFGVAQTVVVTVAPAPEGGTQELVAQLVERKKNKSSIVRTARSPGGIAATSAQHATLARKLLAQGPEAKPLELSAPPPSVMTVARTPPPPPFPIAATTSAGAALAAGIAGTVFALQAAEVRAKQEQAMPLQVHQLDWLADMERIETERRTLAIVSYSLSALGLGISTWLFLAPQKDDAVAVAITPAGASLTVSLD